MPAERGQDRQDDRGEGRGARGEGRGIGHFSAKIDGLPARRFTPKNVLDLLDRVNTVDVVLA